MEVVDGRNDFLYILDFSFKRDVLMELHKKFKGNIQVIDHHKTAKAELDGQPFCIFDMNKCGAVLSWEFFNQTEKLPLFFEYIQDYDIWTKKMPYTDEATAYINSFERTIDMFHAHIKTFEFSFENLVREGAAMLRYHNRDVDKVCASARKYKWDGDIDCVIVNTPAFFASDVGAALCVRFPDAKFVACYSDTHEGYRYYSLRSKGEFDVSALAAKFPGGGGHKNASGFTIKTQAKLFY